MDASLARQYLARKFPSLPLEVLARIPVAAEYGGLEPSTEADMAQVEVFGPAFVLRPFQEVLGDSQVSISLCVCVDIQENLLDDQTYAFLQGLALTGRLSSVFGGPPCRTFSLSRYMPPGLPRPLRGRTPSTQ